jgi:SpoVK/Ycf46/Vps4 family AAA+-type ATPase
MRCDSAADSVNSTILSHGRGHESDGSLKATPEKHNVTRNAYRDRLALEKQNGHYSGWSHAAGASSSQGSVRRSLRERRSMYPNMNENGFTFQLDDYEVRHESQSKKGMKRRRQDDTSETESERRMEFTVTRSGRTSRPIRDPCAQGDAEISGDDMYSRIKSTKRRCTERSVRQNNHTARVTDTSDTEVQKEDELSNIICSGDEKDQCVSQGAGTGRLRPRRATVNRRDSSSSDEEKISVKKYSLRPKRAVPVIVETHNRSLTRRPARRDQLPDRHIGRDFPSYGSKSYRHRRPTHNGSSSDSSSSDEEHFQRKKREKMDKNRNLCLPLNFKKSDILKGTLRDRQKAGASLADIEPMAIDPNVNFESIGGLASHLNSLKEMVIFPLLYPEVFDRFKVQVPRGVLFYGPPGTGKTLVARALANECSVQDKKVAFFMRKGADCMSKWVGESERQLRLLFDQAYTMRPSIIFFDEIDGIAPIRSTRQDQIHSSIVSTLLALMDGLDSRGEVIVIGATNRIEAIDPALRRPGRFDREFFFPLPSCEGRKEILSIHTKEWNPRPSPDLIETLAARSVGYCGADLKALCSEAVLLALKKRYRQIYSSKNKLQLDMNAIEVTIKEFNTAISKKIVPASQRSLHSIGKPLPTIMRSLLQKHVDQGLENVRNMFPGVTRQCHPNSADPLQESESDEVDEQLLSLEPLPVTQKGHNRSLRFAGIFRPRYLICGDGDAGQTYVASAILQELEQLNLFKLDSTRTTDDLNAWFAEALNRLPRASVLYVQEIDTLLDVLFDLLKNLLEGLEPTMPLLVLATANSPVEHLPIDVLELFASHRFTATIQELPLPDERDRTKFFQPIFQKFAHKPVEQKSPPVMEKLVEVPIAETRKLSEKELSRLRRKEERSLRQLRNFLRDTLAKLIRDRRFSLFLKPVDTEEVEDYLQVITNPMDLETMMFKIDSCQYESAAQFLQDIELITNNALEYNPNRDSNDKAIRHRACTLRDCAHAIIEAEMESDFEEMCQAMHKEREQRGESPSKSAPRLLRPPVLPASAEKQQRDAEDTELESVISMDVHNNNSNSGPLNPVVNGIANGVENKVPVPKKSAGRKKKKKGRNASSIASSVTSHTSEPAAAAVSKSPEVVTTAKTSETIEEEAIVIEKPEKSQVIVIDSKELDALLHEAADLTAGCGVDMIENLYWVFYRTVSKRVKEHDRSLLPQVSISVLPHVFCVITCHCFAVPGSAIRYGLVPSGAGKEGAG